MKLGLRRSAFLSSFARGLSVLLIALAAGLYFVHVPDHPPGFSIDESSICYNAWTLSQTGHDEYGKSWPLFFRAFGEYKSPTIIYGLAALFRITGPSIAAARILVASFGVLAALLLGSLARKMTRSWIAAAVISGTALLTPWLFESSRLVFEVALYPTLVGLFLLTVWNAHQATEWTWRHVLALALTLALLTYSYSIGRLLGPLLALGLGLFLSRRRALGIFWTWALYLLLCLPLLVFHLHNPDALTGRFKALTYLGSENSVAINVKEFGRHYLANVNPWRWLFTGETNIRDHVEGTASLLAGSVVIAILGVVLILRNHRCDRWWQFVLYCLVVSPIPASLTSNPFPQLRLIAFPIFLLFLMVPAIEWLTRSNPPRTNITILGAVILLIAGQGLFFQRRYHQQAPSLWYVFDARFPRKVLAPALASGQRPVYLLDEPGKSGYIQPLWYGALAHLDPRTFVHLPWGKAAPAGAVILSTEEKCRDCRLIARALNYIVYMVPPSSVENNVVKEPLTAFRADIVCEDPRSIMSAGQTQSVRFLIRNISGTEWPCVGDVDNSYAVTFHGRWIRSDGSIVADREVEQQLPYDIEPGDTVGLALSVTAPSEPGSYFFEADLVQKQVTRFAERGSAPYRALVEIKP